MEGLLQTVYKIPSWQSVPLDRTVTKAGAVTGPTPWCAINGTSCGQHSASVLTASSGSAIRGLSSSSVFSGSCRCRLAHAPKGLAFQLGSTVRAPQLLLAHTPWLMAKKRSWFFSAVRIRTGLSRCFSSCRRSCSSPVGSQRRGKRWLSGRSSRGSASWIPGHNSWSSSPNKSSNHWV